MLEPNAHRHATARQVIVFPFALAMVLLFSVSASQPAQSQTYKVIYNFTGLGSDGATPYGGPILDQSGNLYGTTNLGGSNGDGSVYKLSPSGSSWTYSSLYSFKGGRDGAGPAFGSLAWGAGGNLFGTTEGGGNFGIAFSVCSCGGKELVVHRFGVGTDGGQPIGGLVSDAAGNLYGTTSLGGTTGNGTVFQEKRSGGSWTSSVIYNFAGGTDAASPPAGVTIDAQGNLYGTSSFGGVNGIGTIYKLTRSGTDWTETILYNFQGGEDGDYPVGGLVLDEAGNLYGTTFDGGIKGGGIVYKFSPSGAGWKFTTLHNFKGSYGGPYNKLTLANGSIYGFTNSDGPKRLGSIFKLTPTNGGWKFTNLYTFIGGTEGGLPYGSLAVDSNGSVFGTAVVGGTDNQGIVFEITP